MLFNLIHTTFSAISMLRTTITVNLLVQKPRTNKLNKIKRESKIYFPFYESLCYEKFTKYNLWRWSLKFRY